MPATTALLALAVVSIAAVVIYWPTAWSMIEIWTRSETFAHGYLVVPAVLWLIWQDRRELRLMTAQQVNLPLLLIAGAGFLWLASRLSEVAVFEQFALVFMIQFAALALLGWRLSRRLAIPLLFLLFAVPFGEVLLPVLIDRTADATVALLRLSGVPVFREGNHFQIPTGRWSVVEACSGLRYLIASLFGGTIYAYVRYRSAWRRLAFVAASLVVPIIANWLRAYGIVMLAHHTNNRLGASVDHIIYGWIFFGLVMLLLFWVGSFWAEDGGSATAASAKNTPMLGDPGPPSGRGTALWRTAALCLVAMGVWPLALHALDGGKAAGHVDLHGLAGSGGWQPTVEAVTWKPHFSGEYDVMTQRFVRDGGQVDLYVAYYRNQTQDSKLISSNNQLIRTSDDVWRMMETGMADITWNGKPLSARQASIRSGNTALKVFELYWVDGSWTSSEYTAKVLLAWAQLRGRGDDSAAIVIAAPQAEGGPPAERTLERFARDMSAPIGALLDKARAQR